MVDGMAEKFLQGLERQLTAFITHKASELVIHSATEASKDAISEAGHARESVRTAYSAAKHAFDATADIPIVGPALAPIAAAGAFAAVSAFGSAEGGQYLVPAPQLTMLHPQEMVLPAAIASRMRDVVEGRSPGASPQQPVTVIVQHSVNAVDAESFQQHLRRYSSMIGNEVARVLRKKGLSST
jgi:predicted phosphoribosyltransferase